MNNAFIEALLKRERHRDRELMVAHARIAELEAPLRITITHPTPDSYPRYATRLVTEWQNLRHATLIDTKYSSNPEYMAYIERESIRTLVEGHVDHLLSNAERVTEVRP
jgi:hypothetical protein